MQLTDFENSAYVVFVVLLTRVILSYKLDFLIPLSKVHIIFRHGLFWQLGLYVVSLFFFSRLCSWWVM